jgi:ketosteroid isomerase-like protein
MSAPFRSNAEVLREAFEDWNAADLEALMAYIHPQIRWETSGIFPGLDRIYEGRAGVRRFWADFMAPWKEISVEPLDISEPYLDRLIAHVRFQGTGKDGTEFEAEIWQLFILRESALVYFRAFRERERAEAAAQGHP